MPVPPFYVAFCLIVLGLFSASKIEGWAMGGGGGGGGAGGAQSGTRNSDGSFAYVGTSGGYHK